VSVLEVSGAQGPGPLPHRGGKTNCLRAIGPDGVVTELAESRGGAPEPRLSHLRINCTDLGASIAWYGSIGFAPLAEPARATFPGWALGHDEDVEVDAVSLALPDDPSFTLELLRWHRPAGRAPEPTTANSQGLYRMALAVENVQEALATVDGLAASRSGEPTWIELPGTPLGGLTVLFLRDPDGVVVELVERPLSALAKRA
jgi:catechol 2,3-dioxygenase-like lactoylglutathione lyase family enzyme